MTENKDVLKKCEAILEWATENICFDPAFVEEVYNRAERGEEVSYKQDLMLDRIIEKFDIYV